MRKDVRLDRIGEINFNKFNTPMKIIEYNNSNNIVVEFQDEHKYKMNTTYNYFKKGIIKNPYDKSVLGVGYLGETSVKSNGNLKRSYIVWQHILERTNNINNIWEIIPTYTNCNICDEWLCYANFEKWYDENYYECPIGGKMCVDKDILIKGNKTYSPQTCCIVPAQINTLFCKTNSNRGDCCIGVYKNGNKFTASFSRNDERYNVHIGDFDTEIEAFLNYKKAKEQYIKEQADKFKKWIPNNVYEALYNYKVEITD